MGNRLTRPLLLLLASALFAFQPSLRHGTMVREASLRVTPRVDAEKLVNLERGRDLIILDQTNVENQQWLRVYVMIPQEERAPREITGWITGKGVVTAATTNGDQIVYGEAVDSENQAEQRGGRKGAALDAMRLYYRLTEIFPSSPLAAESMWRAADIRWQLEKAEVLARPSAREMDPDARTPMDDQNLKQLQKKYPNSKWADLAAYDLIDNKLCGNWKGLAICPEKESDIYEHYAREHPRSPKAAEALYNAAWRQAALADIYGINNETAKSAGARKKAIVLAQEISNQYAALEDWKARALALIYKLEQGIAVYGSQRE